MSSSVEQIKERLGIVDVVGSYIKLEKAGANFRARCPFHNEKSPSFFVSPSRESYHCFGCNKGGDIITFVQEIEGLDFLAALETLARKAGIELKPTDTKQRSENDRLYALMERATAFYEGALARNQPAKDYLLGRGLTEETIKNFRIGLAPEGWRNLYDAMVAEGYADSELDKAGLVAQSSSSGGAKGSRLYDRFRNRVMFPLANNIGKPVGFSGRTLSKEEQAKYINSPQTVLYDKSQVLYGFDRAKVEIKRQDFAVLVEGQMDLVLAHQAGTVNAVAVSGTALTDKHLAALKRLSSNLVMAFDGDLAGIAAARRGIDLALSLGMEVKIAELPAGQDPADVIAADPQMWYAAVTGAKHVIDFYLSVLAKRGYDSRALKLAISQEVLPYVPRLANAIDQAHFVTKIAGLLNIAEEPIWLEIRKLSAPAPQAGRQPVKSKIELEGKASRRDILLRRIVGLYFWQETVNPSLAQKMHERVMAVIAVPLFWQQHLEKSAADKNRLILESEIAYEGMVHLEREIDDLISFLHEEELREKLNSLTLKIRLAEETHNYDELSLYLKQFQEISKAINELKK